MDTNTCGVNHLDADALLPPRKRLLAGLKRQNSDVNFPAPSTPSSAGSKNNPRVNNLLRSPFTNLNLSNEEIVEASRIAAIEATKVAEAARANAEIKAAKAAKAVAAAKSALELVATLSEAADKEKCLKRNKMKKHVTVETLYNKHKRNTNCRTDEELARKLHRAINSSPRILKNSSGSDTKNHKHKRMKSSNLSGRSLGGVSVGEGNQPSTATSNGSAINSGPIKNIETIMVDLNTSTSDKVDRLKLKNNEVETLPSNNKFTESLDSFGKKRGRIKQKKLPLSICSFRDQTSLKEELMKPQLEDKFRTAMNNQPLFSMGSSGNTLTTVERKSMWKCQSFKLLQVCSCNLPQVLEFSSVTEQQMKKSIQMTRRSHLVCM